MPARCNPNCDLRQTRLGQVFSSSSRDPLLPSLPWDLDQRCHLKHRTGAHRLLHLIQVQVSRMQYRNLAQTAWRSWNRWSSQAQLKLHHQPNLPLNDRPPARLARMLRLHRCHQCNIPIILVVKVAILAGLVRVKVNRATILLMTTRKTLTQTKLVGQMVVRVLS